MSTSNDTAFARLEEGHTCNCGPCKKVPELMVQVFGLLKQEHTCECEACKANVQLVANLSKSMHQNAHTCHCDTCSKNQEEFLKKLGYT